MLAPSVHRFRHSLESPWTYSGLDKFQREIQQRVLDGGIGAILLSETKPVITFGARYASVGAIENLRQLFPNISSEVDLFPTDRGGKETYHGPGQWVLFCVDRIDRLTGKKMGVKRAIEGLARIGQIALCEAMGDSKAVEFRQGDELGLWTLKGKIGSIGIRVEKTVVLHGLSVNLRPEALSFSGINPCGLMAQPDYLWNHTGGASDVDFETFGDSLVKAAQGVFWRGREEMAGLDSSIEDLVM